MILQVITEYLQLQRQALIKFKLGVRRGGDIGGNIGGKGAYTEGEINLNKGDRLFVYVGESSDDKGNIFNGSEGNITLANGRAGGGATDIRLVKGTWNSEESLRSRIMVAARRRPEQMDIQAVTKMEDMVVL